MSDLSDSVSFSEAVGQSPQSLISQPSAKEVNYTARTEFDGVSGFLQTGALPDDSAPSSNAEFDEILLRFGYDPSKVRIVGNPRISRWQRFDGEWLASYRFHLEAIDPSQLVGVSDRFDNLDRLVRELRGRKQSSPDNSDSSDNPDDDSLGCFVFQAGDQQLFKYDSGDDGFASTVERYFDSLQVALDEYRRLKRVRRIGGVSLVFPGDHIEGVVSQGGRNIWRTTGTVTEQMRVFRRLLMETVGAFAPVADRVWLRVVNGNHDEATRVQNTRPDDGYATEQAIAVADALKLNEKKFGHITVEVPPIDQGYMTVRSFGTVFTIAHGHQWRRGKAMDWLANQALHGTNVAGCDFLLHGHEHRLYVDTNSERTVICSPAYDAGSSWLANGSSGLRGGVSFVTMGKSFTDFRLI